MLNIIFIVIIIIISLFQFSLKNSPKQPPEVFYKQMCSSKFKKIHRKTQEFLFNKVDFEKLLRTSFLQNTFSDCFSIVQSIKELGLTDIKKKN